MLFTLYTDNHRGSHETSIIKYADDTAIVGLIKDSELDYKQAVCKFVDDCHSDQLELNVKKTKELIIDFRRKPSTIVPIEIKNKVIETVNEYKYLGLIISKDLTWKKNTQLIKAKAMKKLYFLRTLKKFEVSNKILKTFYDTIIGSTLTFSIVIWGDAITQNCLKKLKKIEKYGKKLTQKDITPLLNLHRQRIIKFAKKILNDPAHPLAHEFQTLYSGIRLRTPKFRTTRFQNSFIPNSIKILNCYS